MAQHPTRPGDHAFVASDDPGYRYGVFFEDDAETGYFYAVDLTRLENRVLDAVRSTTSRK